MTIYILGRVGEDGAFTPHYYYKTWIDAEAVYDNASIYTSGLEIREAYVY